MTDLKYGNDVSSRIGQIVEEVSKVLEMYSEDV
jgi:hypothetical protein